MEIDLDLHEWLALSVLTVAAVIGFTFWLLKRRGK